MAFGHLMDTCSSALGPTGVDPRPTRSTSVGLVHLGGMDTTTTTHDAAHDTIEIEPVLTLSALAAHLSVSVQTLYDQRPAGKGSVVTW